MLLAMEGGEKDVQEKPLNFLPLPSKPRPVFCFWTSSPLGIFLSPPGLFAGQIRESCPGARRGSSSRASPPARRWAALGGEAGASQGSRAASPLPAPASLVAALLFSLARAAGCDARFLLSLQTQGRGLKGMVGFA